MNVMVAGGTRNWTEPIQFINADVELNGHSLNKHRLCWYGILGTALSARETKKDREDACKVIGRAAEKVQNKEHGKTTWGRQCGLQGPLRGHDTQLLGLAKALWGQRS